MNELPNGLPTLSAGAHDPGEGKACVMEYVSLLAGEKWSDSPACTNPVLARAAQRVNDTLTDDERHLLVPLIGRLFGTDVEIDNRRLALWCARSVEHFSELAKACNDVTEKFINGEASLLELEAARIYLYAYAATSASAAYYAASAAADAALYAARYAYYATSAAAYAAYDPYTHLDAPDASAAYAAAAAADAADYAANLVSDVAPNAAAKVAWLSRLIDEYDRLAGRAEHRKVTDSELAALTRAVNA